MVKRSKNQKLHNKMKEIYKQGKRKSNASTNPNRQDAKDAKKDKFSHYRDPSTIRLLNLYKSKPDE